MRAIEEKKSTSRARPAEPFGTAKAEQKRETEKDAEKKYWTKYFQKKARPIPGSWRKAGGPKKGKASSQAHRRRICFCGACDRIKHFRVGYGDGPYWQY